MLFPTLRAEMYSILLTEISVGLGAVCRSRGREKMFSRTITQQGEKISSKQQCNPFYLKVVVL